MSPLIKGTEIINHRGPDDEGYLLWNNELGTRLYAGMDTSRESNENYALQPLPEKTNWKVGLGHRRLSIIDLSPGGHQPMIDEETGISLTYNGEIYNYKELRTELAHIGHNFKTDSDTEVLLKSWKEWGTQAPSHFNGMFAFVILDPWLNKLYAVRDRFGIKPLYYTALDDYFVIASEIKQIKSMEGFQPSLNESVAYDYLAHGLLDHSSETFDTQIFQLRGGEIIAINLGAEGDRVNYEVNSWYKLAPNIFKGSKEEAEERFIELFSDSVRLRLRADVKVGSCLSGGLDSSAIVCQAAELLSENGHQNTLESVTSRYSQAKYDEWQFAEKIISQTNAKGHQVWPTSDKLVEDLDRLLWHMDEPFGSTSQFSQWCVFERAAQIGLKVMLDGQGADELLAGYGGNDVPLYSGLLKKGKFKSLHRNYKGFHREMGYPPKGQLLHALKRTFPIFDSKRTNDHPDWLNLDPSSSFQFPASGSLMEEMILQTTTSSLPALLRYEDRNSMAFSIESRVPFLDYRFVEFILGLPEEFVYHLGVRKIILRDALRSLVPNVILDRKDKMGFVSPEEIWLKKEKTNWFKDSLNQGYEQMPNWFDKHKAENMVDMILNGEHSFNFSPWRILCFTKWMKT